MQKALIVKDDDVRELNEHFDAGWSVVHSCPMPSSCTVAVAGSGYITKETIEKFQPQCLVILSDKRL